MTQCHGLTHTVSPAAGKNKTPCHNTAATWETPSQQINDTACPRGPAHRWGEQTNLWSVPGKQFVSYGVLYHHNHHRPPPLYQLTQPNTSGMLLLAARPGITSHTWMGMPPARGSWSELFREGLQLTTHPTCAHADAACEVHQHFSDQTDYICQDIYMHFNYILTYMSIIYRYILFIHTHAYICIYK